MLQCVCVFNILELSNVVERRVFNMFHQTVAILHNAFVRSSHFTHVFEGRNKQNTLFLLSQEPWGTECKVDHQERVLFHIEVRALYAGCMFRGK